MRKSQGNFDDVVMVGEVNGFHIQVLRLMTERGMDYFWRVLKDDKIVKYSDSPYDSKETAFGAAVEWLIPDAEEIGIKQPSPEDFEAINALLYVGGLQEEITSISDAVGLFTAFAQAKEAVEHVKSKAKEDIADIEDILASSNRSALEEIENLNAIHGIFQAQCDLIAMITERNMQTLSVFIEHFVQR